MPPRHHHRVRQFFPARIHPQKSISAAIPEWTTLYFSAGKKDKVNKIDIVGFLMKKGNLEKEEIGLITVKDHACYAAIKRGKAKSIDNLIENLKIRKKVMCSSYHSLH